MTDPCPSSLAVPSSTSAGDGAWIGVDFGTTHSCAAVWDSARGRPKVLRLESALLPPDATSNSPKRKRGRLVPTVLLLVDVGEKDRLSTLVRDHHRTPDGSSPALTYYTTDALRALNLVAVVGAPALRILDWQSEAPQRGTPKDPSPEQLSAAMVTDLKLHFSKSSGSASPQTSSSALTVVPIGSAKSVSIDADVLVEVFLAAMRREAELYLLGNRRRKGLVVPCANADHATVVDHAVMGVPCHWDHRQRHSLEKVAVQPCPSRHVPTSTSSSSPSALTVSQSQCVSAAGRLFASARTIAEPTAAGLSYGLGVGGMARVVLVVDVGGGTTDVSISELSKDGRQQQRVLVTEGAQVGGNDVDLAILEWFQRERPTGKTEGNSDDLSPYEHRTLLRICRQAKEELCNQWGPDAIAQLSFQNQQLRLDTTTFTAVVGPVLGRIEDVVVRALEKHQSITDASSPSVMLDEVVMVGGSTMIPLVSEMLRRVTNRHELCQVHPLTAVAQGAAIHAAQLSHCVPVHELQSALLLDALPFAIGVMVSSASTNVRKQDNDDDGDSGFVPVLAQYASVPARGSLRFALADKSQTGVTVPVVERIDSDDDRETHVARYETIQSFQFLLRKLSPEHLQAISARFVEIRILYTEIGQLFVTVVDELDPEHQRKYKVVPTDAAAAAAQSLGPSDAPPMGLIVTVVALALLYIAVKLAFHEVELKGT